MKNLNRGLAALPLIVIIVVVVSLGAYWYNQKSAPAKDMLTSAETADWKTYTNKEFGFEFKYPSGWAECPSHNAEIFCLKNPKSVLAGFEELGSESLVIGTPVPKSYDSLKTELSSRVINGTPNDFKEGVTANGIKYLLFSSGEMSRSNAYYFFQDNMFALSLTYYAGGDSNNRDLLPNGEPLVSTFRFTK